jgi:phosphohistidine phosphatase SixA
MRHADAEQALTDNARPLVDHRGTERATIRARQITL